MEKIKLHQVGCYDMDLSESDMEVDLVKKLDGNVYWKKKLKSKLFRRCIHG